MGSVRARGVALRLSLLLLVGACSTGQPGAIPAPNPAWRTSCAGSSCVPTPDVVGRLLGSDLHAALTEAGAPQALGQLWYRVSDLPVGTVLAQAPWPGERMLAAGGLSVVVSGGPVPGSTTVDWCAAHVNGRCDRNGPTASAISIERRSFVMPGEAIEVPDVTGLPRRRAERILRHAGLFFHAIAAGGSSDEVLAQEPPPGEPFHSTGEVELRVACEAASPTTPSGGYVYDECTGAIYWAGSS